MAAKFLTDEEMVRLEASTQAQVPPPDPTIVQAAERPSVGEAFGRGIEQGASLGLARPARVFSGGLFEALHPELEQAALPFGQRLERGMRQESGREETQLKQIQEDRPIAFGAGRVVGSMAPIAPAFVAGAVPAIATGATAGAVEAVSAEEDPLAGAVIGAAGGAAGAGAAKALQGIGKSLGQIASMRVLKSLKLPRSVLRRLSSPKSPLGRAKAMADDLVDLKVAQNPKTLKGFQAKAADARGSLGKELKRLYGEADDAVPDGFSAAEVKEIIGSTLDEALNLLPDTDVAKIASKIASGLPEDRIPVSTVWEFVKTMDSATRIWSRASEPLVTTMAGKMNTASNALRGAMLDRVSAVNAGLAKNLTVNSGAFRSVATAEEALREQILAGVSKPSAIQRKGIIETVSDLSSVPPIRLGLAKTLRGAAGVTRAGQALAQPTGIAGAIQGRNR